MRSRGITRLLVLALALLPALAVAGLGGLSAARKIETFQPIGFEARGAAGAWEVTGVSESAVGLEVGDRIVLVNGSLASDAADLRQRLVGRAESVLVLQRGAELVTAPYTRPALDFDFPYLMLVLVGAAYLLIGLYTVVRHRRVEGLVFYLWSLTSAAAYLLTTGPVSDGMGRLIHVADGLALAFLGPLTLHLFTLLPSQAQGAGRSSRWMAFAYLPAVAMSVLRLDLALFGGQYLFGTPTRQSVAAFDRLEILHLLLFAIASLAVLIVRWRSTPAGEQQRQLGWIAIGVGFGYLPYVVLEAVPWALGLTWPEPVTSVAVVALGLVPISFAYAILRYKLWDLGLIVRNTISLTVTLLLGVLGFSLVNLLISRGLPQELTVARNLLSFGTGLAIASLVVPTRRALGVSLERMVHGASFSSRRALAGLGRELLFERDLDRLAAELLDGLQDGLAFDEINLLLVEGGAAVPIRPRAGLPSQLRVEDFSDEFWRSEVTAIPATELPGASASGMQALFRSGYRYAFPLTVRGERVGQLLTGYKEGELPLSSEDVDLVRQVTNQAALAIENAQLLDQLHRQLEETMRLERYSQGIVESSPAGIAVLDGESRVTSANLAFAALAGKERRRVLGLPFDEVLPVNLPAVGVGVRERRFEVEGEARHLQLSVAALPSGGGEQRIVMAQDVSERVEMENQLREKERLAALGMLAAGVAHEVNTPITGISSYAQLLLDDTPEDDPRHRLLKKVETQTFRAAKIVTNLLEFARDRDSETRAFDLGASLQEVIDLLAERRDAKEITVSYEPPTEGVWVFGCESELHQVFSNLLVNAFDAVDRGGLVELVLESGASRVQVSVVDDGPGIERDQMEKIFQPFFSTKLSQGGTGLGLSISYEIVRRHDGELKVDSTPGVGSCFVVDLPRHRSGEGAQ